MDDLLKDYKGPASFWGEAASGLYKELEVINDDIGRSFSLIEPTRRSLESEGAEL